MNTQWIRRMRITSVLPLFAAAAMTAASCSRTTPPPPAQPSGTVAQAEGGVAGEWIHREMPVRYLESMTLAVSGERVTGTGTYTMEGGRTGNTAITGTWRGGALTLQIVRDSGVHEQYAGRLAAGRLTGTLTIDGNAQPFAFERPQ